MGATCLFIMFLFHYASFLPPLFFRHASFSKSQKNKKTKTFISNLCWIVTFFKTFLCHFNIYFFSPVSGVMDLEYNKFIALKDKIIKGLLLNISIFSLLLTLPVHSLKD